jgi:transcriptional regulator with XRE-family HTH domain
VFSCYSGVILVQKRTLVNTQYGLYHLDMSKFSKWLEDAMHKHGGHRYGGAALSRDLSLRRATVSDWLNDKATPRREHIALLAMKFGVTSRYLYKLLDVEPPSDLNDVIEQVNAIAHKLSPSQQQKLLDDLRGKYGEKI